MKKTNFNITFDERYKYTGNGVTLDSETSEGYSEATIKLAKQLKEKDNSKHNDSFYLEYAQRCQFSGFLANINEHTSKMNLNTPIKDLKWAQYSYEEIIEMFNNGVNVPKEVILWAKAQQQNDVVDYVVISEDSQNEDSSTEPITGAKDLSILRVKALQNITKTEDAETKTQELYEEYKDTFAAAEEKRTEIENKTKQSVNEILSLTEEWTKLNHKKNSGELSKDEQKRYEELGKTLNKANKNFDFDAKFNAAIMDDFLNSLDNLELQNEQNLKLSIDTYNSAKALNDLEQSYSANPLPLTNNSFGAKGNEARLIYGIAAGAIADTALEKSSDLGNLNLEISSELFNTQNINLAKFVRKNTEISTKEINDEEKEPTNIKTEQTDENTQNNEETQNPETTDETESTLKAQTNQEISMEFTPVNAVNSANTTLEMTSELFTSQNIIDKDMELLKQMLKQRESVKPEMSTSISQNNIETPKDTQKENSVSDLSKNVKTTNNNLQTQDDLISKQKEISEKTLAVGIGTNTIGNIHSILGAEMITTGAALMTNPFTLNLGILQTYLGQMILTQGILEGTTGLGASASAIYGLEKNKQATDFQKSTEEEFSEIEDSMNPKEELGTPTPEQSQDTDAQTQNTDAQTQDTDAQIQDTDAQTETITEAKNEENEETSEQNEKDSETNTKDNYSVSMGFGADYAINATNTTIAATSDLISGKTQSDEQYSRVNTASKNSEKAVSEAETTFNNANSEHQNNLGQMEVLKGESENLNATIDSTGSTDEAMSAQVRSEAILAQYQDLSGKELTLKSTTSQAISSNINQINQFRNSVSDMEANLSNFTQKAQNQLKVSEDTLIVGHGTTIAGVFNSNIGAEMMATGAALMSNPFTINLGILQTVLGNAILQKGVLELETGAIADISALGGIAFNTVTQKQIETSEAFADEQKAKSKDDISKIDDLKDGSEIKLTTDHTLNQRQVQIEETEDEDDITLAASAATNANISDSTVTDDKADKKLTRFNTDSIIESKRKRKKVMAVSSSARS